MYIVILLLIFPCIIRLGFYYIWVPVPFRGRQTTITTAAAEHTMADSKLMAKNESVSRHLLRMIGRYVYADCAWRPSIMTTGFFRAAQSAQVIHCLVFSQQRCLYFFCFCFSSLRSLLALPRCFGRQLYRSAADTQLICAPSNASA